MSICIGNQGWKIFLHSPLSGISCWLIPSTAHPPVWIHGRILPEQGNENLQKIKGRNWDSWYRVTSPDPSIHRGPSSWRKIFKTQGSIRSLSTTSQWSTFNNQSKAFESWVYMEWIRDSKNTRMRTRSGTIIGRKGPKDQGQAGNW